MDCGHNVCRECVIDRESQNLPIICYYDNDVVHGIDELAVNGNKLKLIQAQAKLELEKLYSIKVAEARTPIINPSSIVTRQDVGHLDGKPIDLYKGNMLY